MHELMSVSSMVLSNNSMPDSLNFQPVLTIDLVVDFGPRTSDFDENFGDDFGFSSSSASERFSNGSSTSTAPSCLGALGSPVSNEWND